MVRFVWQLVCLIGVADGVLGVPESVPDGLHGCTCSFAS